MLCAGVEDTILSGCHGDSGGPYVCLNADGKTYTLHGAVSWGSGRCDAKQLFTVFARVTQFRAWIKTHTGLGGGGGGDVTFSICNLSIFFFVSWDSLLRQTLFMIPAFFTRALGLIG